MYNKIKNLNGSSNKLKFILNYIFDEHKNLSEKVNLIGQLTPYRNMVNIESDLEEIVDGLLGYLVYVEKYSLKRDEFINEVKKNLFQYMKKNNNNNNDFKFKIKKYSCFLREL
jgi:hypothetical protein